MATKKWSEIRAQKFTPEELRRIDRKVESELLEMDLRTLREAVGLTQGEVAQRVEITQSQLSKMERREDHRISTLRRYVQALGGSLEICAVINGQRIKLVEGCRRPAGAPRSPCVPHDSPSPRACRDRERPSHPASRHAPPAAGRPPRGRRGRPDVMGSNG